MFEWLGAYLKLSRTVKIAGIFHGVDNGQHRNSRISSLSDRCPTASNELTGYLNLHLWDHLRTHTALTCLTTDHPLAPASCCISAVISIQAASNSNPPRICIIGKQRFLRMPAGATVGTPRDIGFHAPQLGRFHGSGGSFLALETT